MSIILLIIIMSVCVFPLSVMLILLAAIFILHITCICLLLAATIHNVSDAHHSLWVGLHSLTAELFINSKSNSVLPQLHPL